MKDLPFADLVACSRLERISVSVQLGVSEYAKRFNAVSFAVMCGILCSTCERGSISLQNFDVSITFAHSSASTSPSSPLQTPEMIPRACTRASAATLSTPRAFIPDALRRLPWGWFNDSLERVGKRSLRLATNCAVSLEIIDADRVSLLEDSKVMSHIQKSVSPGALTSLRFV